MLKTFYKVYTMKEIMHSQAFFAIAGLRKLKIPVSLTGYHNGNFNPACISHKIFFFCCTK